ncbi:MAG TPA: ATP-binding cassette domain-containing protein [Actinobacteria bacterium]|nr:ATP-binding cassette domain-containing protein [Actinomycetota bacterium]
MLRLADLHKRYGDVVALDGCAFGVERGEIVGFLGPNGAGKTTTMRAIFGLVALDEGSVTWDGRPIDHETRLRFGYMPEERGLYPRMTVADQVAWFGRLHGLAPDEATRATDEWLARLGLGERKGSRVEELSHGNQQRAQLAAALVHSPELLVLDEPFAGLDPLGVENLAGLLAERARAGVAVLFSSHQLDLVEDLCERAVIVDHGRVVLDGPIGELRKASRYRYLEVEVVGDRAWWRDRPGVSLVAERDGVVRLRLDGDVDLGELLDAARRAGRIERFTFEPPTLSEVFREAVRR